jgi:asparagine N-glycosylation enzyme membrane subunit Stt3
MSTPLPAATDNDQDDDAPRPPVSPVRLVFRLVLIAAIIIALVQVLGPHFKRVLQWGLEDNDDAMRVLQVRDWLQGQGWFDVSQHRLNPPQGGDMHWSRIGDLLLAALMAPLIAIFGTDLGPKYAAFWTPIVAGVLYVWVGARTAKSLGGPVAFLPGIILVASAPAALSYFLPGRVDHHGLQMTLILAAIWGLFSGTFRSYALAGVAIAAGIAIGLEALPLQIVLIGWIALRWGLRGAEVKGQTLGFGLGFAVALVLFFIATVPSSKWNLPVNDAIGRGYVVLGCAGGLLLAGASCAISQAKLLARFAALIAIGLVVLGGIALFPEIIVPPYGNVDPLLIKLWLNNVNETAPLYSSKLSRVLSFALFPALAAIGAIIAVIMTKDKERDLWILGAMAIIVAAGLAIFWQSRTAGLATAVSGVISAAMIARAYERINWKVAGAFALLVNPIIPGLTGTAIAEMFEPKVKRFVTGGGQGCFNEPSFKALADAKPGLVVAPVDMGARVLMTTPHKVLAAPYHRNNAGNLAAYQVFLMPQADAKQRVKNLGANYVAICKRSAEVTILSREAPGGLMADLEARRVPDWLVALPTPKGSDVLAYGVKPN